MNFFVATILPVLSTEQNDGQSEEINVIDESQAENMPMPMQEASLFVVLSSRSKDSPHSPLTVLVR